MKSPSQCVLATRIAAAAAFLCLAPASRAAERFWITPGGGGFGSPGLADSDWSATDGGAGGATAPTTTDTANFTLNNTYLVDFDSSATNVALDVENGNVTFDLDGFTYLLSSPFGVDIGTVSGQTGRLTVRAGILGGDTTGDDVTIGQAAGSSGFLTVTTGGQLGSALLRPDVFVGAAGTGSLTVNDNGRIDGRAFGVGDFAGSAGTATITGPNAVADFVGGTTNIGNSGSGTLSVTSGGTLSTGAATLGFNLGVDGTATVSGVGSSWTMSSSAFIGNSGDGSLTVASGGLVTTAGDGMLGLGATGFGTATVTGSGSRWSIAGIPTIGSSGLGVLTVSAGGQLVTTGSASLGSNAGGEGRATVTGAGSQWTQGGSISVGSAGLGDLTVAAGGEVSASTVTLGSTATGIGVATITGAASKLTATGNVNVASLGSGTLHVASGAELLVGSSLVVSNPAGTPVGTLNLDGGSIYIALNFSNNGIFSFTDGLLQVAGDFAPSGVGTSFVINGSDSGDLPTLDLIGVGGVTNGITTVTVGNDRRGQLLLRQGRVLDLGVNSVSIGAAASGDGSIGVQSGAQLLTTGVLAVGGTGSTAGGAGVLNLSGGTVDVGTLRIFNGGTVNLSTGTLAVNTAPVLDGLFNWTGGTLRFDAATALTGSNVPKILGLDATLSAGQILASTAAVTLQTPLIVDGGSLNASSLVNQSRLEVRSGSVGAVQNDGLLLGDGTISGAVTNSAAGRIRVDSGKTLFFDGAFAANAGQLNLQGGTLDFSGAITNSATGFITGRGTLHTGGLTNNGQIAFSGGNADVFGDVTLNGGSRVVTSGAGSTTTFFDDVTHNGTEIFTGANASTVIFGAQTGAGSFTGTGTVYSIGDLRPGNSPATVTYGGSLVLGNGTLMMELGGPTEGSQYDSLHIASSFSADGILALSLINGYSPGPGAMFDLFDTASTSGTFDSLTLPPLAQYLAWNTSTLYTSGEVSVQSALTPIEQWRLLYFGTPANSGDGADNIDFDKDGTQNLVEYAFGLDPRTPSADGLPTLSVVTAGATRHVALTITRPLSVTDLTYQIEVGGALVSFLPGSSYSNGGDVSSNANTTQFSRTDDGTFETITVRDNTALTAATSRFLRLKVSNP